MTRGRLVVHAHFYQPTRIDPFTGVVPPEPAAAPYHDWNERVDAECYRPNAERGNLDWMSYDAGPTLAAWLQAADEPTYRRFIASDRPAQTDGTPLARPRRAPRRSSVASAPPAPPFGDPDGVQGNAMAQAFHHTILPLASLADRRTEIRWGIRDFEIRYGRRPDGLWLPETAVDLPTLRLLAEHGIRYTILAPWQAADASLDTRRLYHVDLGGGRAIGVAFYDGGLSGAVSFDPSATADADAFIRDRLIPRFGMPAAEQEVLRGTRTPPARQRGRAASRSGLAGDPPPDPRPDPSAPLVVIATDGELYGHHQKFRDLFLHRLLTGGSDGRADIPQDRGFDVVNLAQAFAEEGVENLPAARIAERTSWSCHHGVARWSAECPDAADGRWKGPLRAALERLAAGIDAATVEVLRREAGRLDPWVARDDYVDVVSGAVPPDAFAARHLGRRAKPATSDRFLDLMEGQRWRLAMFQSDAWYWDDPVRSETRQVLLAAARAVRLVDEVAGTRLEDAFCDDLTLFTSPSRGVDGVEIFHEALAGAGQPA